MSIPQEDKLAPLFTLDSTEGKPIALKDLRGSKVVLYFYPADDTPTCTKQACLFRDVFADFATAGAILLGVSPDDVGSHEKFRKKFKLPFTLLADPDHAVCEKYGVWRQKTMFGNTYMGVVRTTFIIDSTGKITKIFPNVRLAGHIQKILAALDTTE